MNPVNVSPRGVRNPIGGWLLVLCRLLILWQPIIVGLITSRALDSLAIRGRAVMLILLARVLATAFGVAAGLSLRGRHRGAVRIAEISLLLSCSAEMSVYLTPSFPSNRTPGETPLWVLGTLIYFGGWLAYLMRSKRVRETFIS